MDILLTVIIVMGVVLLAVTAYMEWIGVSNLLTSRSPGRYSECGHTRVNSADPHEQCWGCRHATLAHPSRLLHH